MEQEKETIPAFDTTLTEADKKIVEAALEQFKGMPREIAEARVINGKNALRYARLEADADVAEVVMSLFVGGVIDIASGYPKVEKFVAAFLKEEKKIADAGDKNKAAHLAMFYKFDTPFGKFEIGVRRQRNSVYRADENKPEAKAGQESEVAK